jgi:hypothetical protein
MAISRRTFVTGTAAAAAGVATGFPDIFIKDAGQAWGAKPWIAEDGNIMVGLLWSHTGNLSVV